MVQMESMGTEFRWGWTPILQPGEIVRAKWPRVWYLLGKSWPSYRAFFPLPPLWDASAMATDRRIIICARLFVLGAQYFSIWYPGKAPRSNSETFKSASICEPPPGGAWWKFREAPNAPYLEIFSEEPNKHWYRSRIMRLWLVTRNRTLLQQFLTAIESATASH